MALWHPVVLAGLQKHSNYCSSLPVVQVHMDFCVLYSSHTFLLQLSTLQMPPTLWALHIFGALPGDVNPEPAPCQ